MKRVAFNETGNTGNDLVRPEQPVFCLASIHIGEEELAQVAELLKRVKMAEWKFSQAEKGALGGRDPYERFQTKYAADSELGKILELGDRRNIE